MFKSTPFIEPVKTKKFTVLTVTNRIDSTLLGIIPEEMRRKLAA